MRKQGTKDYSADLDYELEMLRALEGKHIVSLEGKAFYNAYKRAFTELARTMSKEHFELVVAELAYSMKCRKEMENLIATGKAYGKYVASTEYPSRILGRLTLLFKRMVWRRALGDKRPLMLPPEVAQFYLTASNERVIIGEFECATCGFEIPFLQTSINRNNPDKLSYCPACGSSLAWWPDKLWTRQVWSDANPNDSVDIYVWPNGRVSYDESLRKRIKL